MSNALLYNLLLFGWVFEISSNVYDCVSIGLSVWAVAQGAHYSQTHGNLNWTASPVKALIAAGTQPRFHPRSSRDRTKGQPINIVATIESFIGVNAPNIPCVPEKSLSVHQSEETREDSVTDGSNKQSSFLAGGHSWCIAKVWHVSQETVSTKLLTAFESP